MTSSKRVLVHVRNTVEIEVQCSIPYQLRYQGWKVFNRQLRWSQFGQHIEDQIWEDLS